ncbi:hypothetical protein [Marinoscillum sp. MHG1-6]|uniref:hypothetical protein n=1 Tax=Marinoscillum sp. MHG1-6 TaxID=2959627 RepID=UPI0021571015|nr:hypothetical protein [Marinoscillum sp. MHG1-6]
MDQERKYRKFIELLKANQPELDNKAELTEGIMKKIGKGDKQPSLLERVDDVLFFWTRSNLWSVGMSTAAVLLIVFFISEQTMLNRRIEDLESKILIIQPVEGGGSQTNFSQQILMKILIKNAETIDSITLYKSDLNRLLRDHMELLDRFEQLKGEGVKERPQKETQRNAERGSKNELLEL